MTQITTCQICGRAIKSSKGFIAHHGYSRPDHGWQTASCYGARFRPFEVACDAIEGAIASRQRWLDQATEGLAARLSSPPNAMFQVRDSKDRRYYLADEPRYFERKFEKPAGFDNSHRLATIMPGYENAYWSMIWKLEAGIKSCRQDIEYLTQRLASWKAAA